MHIEMLQFAIVEHTLRLTNRSLGMQIRAKEIVACASSVSLINSSIQLKKCAKMNSQVSLVTWLVLLNHIITHSKYSIEKCR